MLLIAKTPEYKKLAGLETFFEIRIFSIFRGLPSNFLFFTKNFVIFLINRLNATQKNMGAGCQHLWVLGSSTHATNGCFWVLGASTFSGPGSNTKKSIYKIKLQKIVSLASR